MVRGLEFDVTEMAINDVHVRTARTASHSRRSPSSSYVGFHHVRDRGQHARPASAIRRIWKAARVGVNRGYTVTTGVWARRHPARRVRWSTLDRITWVLSGDEHVAEYRAPANVVPMPARRQTSPICWRRATCPPRSAWESDHPNVAPLIPDADEAGYKRTRDARPLSDQPSRRGQGRVAGRPPPISRPTCSAHSPSRKARYVARLRAGEIAPVTPTDAMNRRVMDITGADPLPYGIEPNRSVIEELIGHAVNQHILPETAHRGRTLRHGHAGISLPEPSPYNLGR